MFQTLRIHIESLQPTFDCCVSTVVVDVKEKGVRSRLKMDRHRQLPTAEQAKHVVAAVTN
eukprot:scaffold262339_cov76-Cyclotella_meneghiniana.AAC.1